MMRRRDVLVLAAALGPAGCACPGQSATPSGPPVATAAPSGAHSAKTGDSPMIQWLRDLMLFLCRDPLSVEDLAARIGPVVEDGGPAADVILRPRDASLTRAVIARHPDTGKPCVVDLELAVPLAVAELRAAFGEYGQSTTERGMPWEIVFSERAGTGLPFKVALIAEIDREHGSVEAAHRLSLRRDWQGE